MGRNHEQGGARLRPAIRHGATEICFPHAWLKHVPWSRICRTSRSADKNTGSAPKRKLRPVGIRRNPGFDVFNVRLSISLDKPLREKRPAAPLACAL